MLDIFFESIFLVDLTWHATLNSRIPIAEHLLYMVSDALQPQGQIKGKKKDGDEKMYHGTHTEKYLNCRCATRVASTHEPKET